MTTLNDLSTIDRKHWELHLWAAVKDTPSVKKVVDGFLAGGKLPDLKHPANIHDWLEHPDERLEKIDG